MRSVVLSGFMATGKTSVGRVAAERLGLPFVDTDALLAAQAGRSVPELFTSEGEGRFREREVQIAIPLLTDGVPRVIAFGGGTVTVPKVRRLALETATVVTLTARPETIAARATSIAERPNLAAASTSDRIADLLELRREAYGECHARIATDDLDVAAIAARIVDLAHRDSLAMPLGTRSYAIELGDGDPGALTRTLRELDPSGVLVVTDSNVERARGPWLEAAMADLQLSSSSVVRVVIEPGEEHKTIATVQRIWDAALAGGLDRRAVVVAFGGGVVGDLAGFAASTILRGVRCVQVATTLLSMVDSSVGGKTGFDHAAGKNLIGSFFQPSRVLLDLEHLTTLDPRQRAAGVAEIVKIALACDVALLERLERDAEAIVRGDRAILREVVRAAVLAKIRVVRDDELETGARALLNLGHTVGHALETQGGYRRLLHGEAVAVGTVLELEATARLGWTPAEVVEGARYLLRRLGLPVSAERSDVEAAWPYVLSDKKRTRQAVKLPVVRARGQATVENVPLDDLRRALLS